MRILVTGGAGFIGSRYVRTMLTGGYAGYEDTVVPVTDRKGHGRRYSLDDSLLRSLGYTPRVPLKDGLKATIEWYAANRDWWEPLHRPAAPERPRAVL